MLGFFILLSWSQATSRQYTVSGFSSGGFFAHQLHVIHSSSITGAGIVAGGPFFCTMGSSVRFQTSCKTNPYLINLPTSQSSAESLSSSGQIDGLGNLTTSKVYIFSGTRDTVVTPGVVKLTSMFYVQNNIQSNNLINNFEINAQHSWVTNNAGNPCWYLGSPGVNNCGFDLSEAILTHLYGTLTSKGQAMPENLYQFDQSIYGDAWKAGLSNRGFIYIPEGCMESVCKVHLVFHGCYGSFGFNGLNFINDIGVNDWAESNQIVVIYPQIIVTQVNPEGCWDFFAYTGNDFNTYNGLQVQIVHAMAQNPPVVKWSSFSS
jgi:poly(3-hydroxybutyrate) depolymerase